MPPVSLPIGQRVPLLPIPDFTLFPGTLVPFHVHARGLVDAVSHSLSGDRRLIVLPPAPAGGRSVGSLGRIVSDRRYEDGRVDIFVHGLERVSACCPDGPDPRFSAGLRMEPDRPHAGGALAGERLRLLSLAFARGLRLTGAEADAEAVLAVLASTQEAGLLSNRLAAFVHERPAERQRLLECRCPVLRCEALLDAIGQRLLSLNTAARILH